MEQKRVTQLEDERLELIRQGLSGQIQALEENINMQLGHIAQIGIETREQAIKTNGRVNKLEEKTLIHQERWNQLLEEMNKTKKEHEDCAFMNGAFITKYEADIKPARYMNFLFSNKRMTAVTILVFSFSINILSRIDVLEVIKTYWTKLLGI